jgi:hypothetical protein
MMSRRSLLSAVVSCMESTCNNVSNHIEEAHQPFLSSSISPDCLIYPNCTFKSLSHTCTLPNPLLTTSSVPKFFLLPGYLDPVNIPCNHVTRVTWFSIVAGTAWWASALTSERELLYTLITTQQQIAIQSLITASDRHCSRSYIPRHY